MADSPAPVAVVGAGPYGLSVAAHLAGRGVPARVFGDPMATWREHMPYGMFLKSTPAASSISDPAGALTYERFCAAQGRAPAEPLSADDFIEYGQWFQQQAVPEVERLRVERLERRGRGFVLRIESGEELVARTVVMASGLLDHVRLPAQLSPLRGSPFLSHSSDHGDLSALKEQRVAVIGSGQSALECAVLLAEAGADVHLVARKPSLLWGGPPQPRRRPGEALLKPASPLGPGWSLAAVSSGAGAVRWLPVAARRELGRRILGPSGAWWLHERFDREITLHLGRRIDSASAGEGGAALELAAADGRERLEVDHVLAATGYEVSLDSVGLLEPGLRASVARVPGSGSPRLSRAFESSVEGLYFVGLPGLATFGPLLRFVCGTGFAARRVSAAVARRR